MNPAEPVNPDQSFPDPTPTPPLDHPQNFNSTFFYQLLQQQQLHINQLIEHITTTNTHHPKTTKLPLKAPPTFSGDKSREQNERDLQDYLSNMKIHLSAGEYSNPDMIRFCSSYLAGQAKEWFGTKNLSFMLSLSFDQFSRNLSEVFGAPHRSSNAIQSLTKIRQGTRSAVNYSNEFYSLLQHYKLPDELSIEMFTMGLSDELRYHVHLKDNLPEDFSDFVDAVIRLDNRLADSGAWKSFDSNKKDQSSSPTSPPPVKSNSFRRYTNQNISSSHPIEGPTPMEICSISALDNPRGPLTREEKNRRLNNKLCIYCASPQHHVRDCPSLPCPPTVHIRSIAVEAPTEPAFLSPKMEKLIYPGEWCEPCEIYHEGDCSLEYSSTDAIIKSLMVRPPSELTLPVASSPPPPLPASTLTTSLVDATIRSIRVESPSEPIVVVPSSTSPLASIPSLSPVSSPPTDSAASPTFTPSSDSLSPLMRCSSPPTDFDGIETLVLELLGTSARKRGDCVKSYSDNKFNSANSLILSTKDPDR